VIKEEFKSPFNAISKLSPDIDGFDMKEIIKGITGSKKV
jgi:hypothetical protein